MPGLPPVVAELRVKSGEVATKFKEAMDASDKLAQQTTGNSAATGSAFDKLSRGGQLAFGALTGVIGTVVGESAHMAGDFQEKMTLLTTSAGESKSNMDTVSNGILDMAPKVQTTTDQLASGMYMIESAGFHGADGLNVLKSAAEGAKVGNADLGTTADALTTVMKDYNIPTAQAADTTSKLVATVANGKTTMQDLAGSMSSILPFSSGLGVSLTDTMGAMATMTGEGVKADQAATYLKFTMMALANETPKGAKALKDVGLSSTQVATDLKSKGLSGTLAEITDAIAKKFPKGSAEYTAAVADIVGGTRGMAAALALTGDHAATYTDNIKKIGEATADQSGGVEGFAEASQDLNNKMAGIGQQFAAAGIRIGTALIPALSTAADKFMVIFNYLSSHMGIVYTLAAIFGAVLTIAITAWAMKAAMDIGNTIVQFTKMSMSMASGAVDMVKSFGNIGKGFGDVAGGMDGAYGKMGSFGGRIKGVVTGLGDAGKAALDWMKNTVTSFTGQTAAIATNTAVTGENEAATTLDIAAREGDTVATEEMTVAQDGLNASLLANPIMLIVLLIGALIAAVVLAYNNIGWFKDFVNTVWAGIKVVVGAVVGWFVSSVVPVLATVWNVIATGAIWLYKSIIEPYFNAWMPIVQGVIGFLTGTVLPIMGAVFHGIGDVVVWLVTNVVVPYVSMWISVIQSVVDWIFGTAVPFISSAFQTIGSIVVGVVSFFVQFETGAQNAVGNVINFFLGLPGQIIGALSGAGSWLVGVGENIIQGLISGVSNMIGAAVSAVQNVGGQMLDGVKSFLGIKSPSRRFHDEVGAMMGAGVVTGVESMIPAAQAALAKLTMPLANTPVTGLSGTAGGGSQSYGAGAPAPVQQVTNTYHITVTAKTNASAKDIAGELGWQLAQMS